MCVRYVIFMFCDLNTRYKIIAQVLRTYIEFTREERSYRGKGREGGGG
jgi:hypothetical protein